MKNIFVLTVVVCLLCTSFCSNKKPEPQMPAGFAVVELFTSEGCSSCPRADNLLSEIRKDYADQNVLVLSYHVDYWDRLGWRDSFGSAMNTDRQNFYAELFELNSIYTPQAVVNGKRQFIGSDKGEMLSAIKSTDLRTPFSIQAELKGNKLLITVKGTNLKPDETILVALVQKQGATMVKKGENEGKELKHVNIVREFNILSGKTTTTEFVWSEKEKENFFIAALLQKKDGTITGFETSQIR